MAIDLIQSLLGGQQGFDPVGALQRGRQAASNNRQDDRNQEIMQLQNTLANQAQAGGDPRFSQEQARLGALAPKSAEAGLASFMALDKDRQHALVDDAKKGLQLVKQNRVGDLITLATNRKEDLLNLDPNADTSDTDAIIQQATQALQTGDFGQLTQSLNDAAGIDVEALNKAKKLKSESRLTSNERDERRLNVLLAKAEETGLQKDRDRADRFSRKAGFARSTEQEKSDIKVDAAERKEIAKFTVKRKQGFIEKGVEAADSTALIRRSLDLMKDVKTGGFDNIALKINNLLGTTGADELELSTNLGQSVLKQLKPMFGSAFTENEGARLESISARFGTSTAGNVRLLKQILRISERAAKRGLAASIEQNGEDNFTAKEIQAALSFNFEDDEQEDQTQAPQTQGAAGDVSDDDLKKLLGLP